jgi:Calx-beta domain-containing protein
MRRWKIMGVVMAVAATVGTVALAVPKAGAVPVCDRTITIEDAEESEGAGQIWFKVTLFAPAGCDRTASVKYGTSNLTGDDAAKDGEDYEKTDSEEVSWDESGSGTTMAHISVKVFQDDGEIEPNERFMVQLHDAIGAKNDNDWATGTIVDDDNPSIPPHLTVSMYTDIPTSPDCTVCRPVEPCEFSVWLSMAIMQPVTVNYATIGGTAREGEDFAGVRDGLLTIPAGATRGTIKIDVFRNLPGEPSEVFRVVLTKVSPGTIGHAGVEVHIPGSS